MNSLDVVIIVVAVAFAVSGVVQGLVANLAATIGLFACGLLAVLLVPRIVSPDEPSLASSLVALGIVVVAAAGGQIAGTVIGTNLRRTIRSRAGRLLDAVGGGALSVVSVLVVSWALGYAVSGTSVPYLSQASRGSTIMGAVDEVMPSAASNVLQSFSSVIDANLFPRYLDPFDSEDIPRTGPPDPATLQQPGVQAAAASVVKILGDTDCGRGVEGSGFVYAEERIMTNAHVVAGVDRPAVVTDEGRRSATVVHFDPALDVAVLAVDVDLPALGFDEDAEEGQEAAVIGYPGNGPLDIQSARVREEIRLRSPDIYDRGEHLRESYSIRGLVRSGNSGGPLVSVEGRVLGVIFAASVTDDSTGYALTAAQVAESARAGVENASAVDTGECT